MGRQWQRRRCWAPPKLTKGEALGNVMQKSGTSLGYSPGLQMICEGADQSAKS
jgi:hypothetical protein